MKQVLASILLALTIFSAPAAGGARGANENPATSFRSRKLQQEATGTTTIVLTLQVPATSALESTSSLQQHYITQLSSAAADYFHTAASEVSVWFNGKQQRLQAGITARQVVVQVQPTWLAGDTTIPAYLQQQLQALQDAPSTIIPNSMIQLYNITASNVVLAAPVSVQPPLPATGYGSSSQQPNETAAIAAGVAVGGVALVVLAIITVYWFRRNRSRQSTAIYPIANAQGASGASSVQSHAGAKAAVTAMAIAPRAPSHLGPLFAHLYQQGNVTITMGMATTGATTGAPHSGSDRQAPSESTTAPATPPATQLLQTPVPASAGPASQNSDLDGLRIPWSSITLGGVLGTGGQGEVLKGLWQHNNVAVKQLNFGSCDAGRLQALYQEARIMRDLHHPCIARVYGIVDEAPHHAVVMQYYRHGTLSKFMASATYPSDLQARLRIAIQVASGMSFMHSKGVLHGDLKTSNLLLDDGHRVVISDFGLAASVDATSSSSSGDVSGAGQTCGGALTVSISPPEVLMDPRDMRLRSAAADVYAFGIVLLETMSSCQTYRGMRSASVKALVCSGRRPTIPSFIPASVASIIDECWAQEPAARPSFEIVLDRLTAAQQGWEHGQAEDLTATQTMTALY